MEAYAWTVWILGPRAIAGAALIAAFWVAGVIIQKALGRVASRSELGRRNILLLTGAPPRASSSASGSSPRSAPGA